MRFLRLLFSVLLALVLIASMGIFILFQTFDTDKYLSQFTQKATLALGRPVSIGHVGLGLSSQSGITLDLGPFKIMDDQGFTSQPFIQIDRVRVSLDLGSLIFRRDIRITGIGLESLRLHFIRARNGDLNARSIVQANRFSGDAVKQGEGLHVAPVSNIPSVPKAGPGTKLNGIRLIKIQDAAVSFIDQNDHFPLDIWLTGIDLDLQNVSSTGSFPISFDASLYRDIPNVHASAILSFDPSKRTVGISDLRLNMDLSKLDIVRLKGISPQMQNSTVLKDISGVVQLNVAHLEMDASGNLTADGDIGITGGVIKNFNIVKMILSHSLGNFGGIEGNIDDLLNGQLKDKLGAQDTVIERAEAQFSIHDKTIFIDDSLIKTDIFELTAKGSVGQGLNVDMQTMLHLNNDVSAALVNDLEGLKFLCDDSKRIAIGASLKGVIPHLKYKPDKDFKKKSRESLDGRGKKYFRRAFRRWETMKLWMVAGLLIVVCLAVYWPHKNAGFVLDDYYTVVRNPLIKNPSLYQNIWTSRLFDAHRSSGYIKFGYYRPVLQTSWILDYRLFGLKASGYQWMNLLIHALNCFYLYFILALIWPGPLALKARLLFCCTSDPGMGGALCDGPWG